MAEPSEWQKRITGEWHGRPSLFDATGTWCGYEDIRRSSVFENGVTTYYMDGGLTGAGRWPGSSGWARRSRSGSRTPTTTGCTPGRTSTAPASPTARSSTRTTTAPAGRST
ncbi:hypothetical protein ACFQZ4_12345 [Catellatospora coxensis]